MTGRGRKTIQFDRFLVIDPNLATAKMLANLLRALSPEAKKGIDFLVRTQLPSGAWGQGDEAPTMGSGNELRAIPNVADTSMAGLALLRAGNTPTEGTNSKSVVRAIDYIVGSIEKSDDKSLYVTDVRNTRTQMKLGPYVDTFASSLNATGHLVAATLVTPRAAWPRTRETGATAPRASRD